MTRSVGQGMTPLPPGLLSEDPGRMSSSSSLDESSIDDRASSLLDSIAADGCVVGLVIKRTPRNLISSEVIVPVLSRQHTLT
jgi:hypothetical protein